MGTIQKIGVFTSGGDCAGLNAAIRAVTLHATKTYGWQVIGLSQSLCGMMKDPPQVAPLTPGDDLDDSLTRGGSILGSKSLKSFLSSNDTSGLLECVTHIEKIGLDGLIGIGGNGSLKLFEALCHHSSIPLIFIPKTIDHDLPFTESSIGFSSAVEVVTETLDQLRAAAEAQHRLMILQVMGREAGHIALHAGIAGGADIILIPEIPYFLPVLQKKITDLHVQGRKSVLCVVSESVPTMEGHPSFYFDSLGQKRYEGIGNLLRHTLENLIPLDICVTVLGHLQRGGSPSPYDRLLASTLGVHAVDLIAQKKGQRMVIWRNQRMDDLPLSDVIHEAHPVDIDGPIVYTARKIGICFGDK